jgi:hypothetical protein
LLLLPAFVAELSLALWLLVKGVDQSAWRSRLSSIEPSEVDRWARPVS